LSENTLVVGASDTDGEFNHGFTWSPLGGASDVAGNGHWTIARAVNGSDEVAGVIEDPLSRRAFVWDAAGGLSLRTAGDADTSAHGLNDDGIVVGSANVALGSVDDGSIEHAVLWDSAGSWRDLGTLAGPGGYSVAFAVNAAGDIVGITDVPSADRHAFIIHACGSSSAMQDLGTLGGPNSGAYAINGASPAQVVGFAATSGSAVHAALWTADGSSAVDLGTLAGGPSSTAMAINSGGYIVGTSDTDPDGASYGVRHAVLWGCQDGIKDLNDYVPQGTGWVLNVATGINDSDQIVGVGMDADGYAAAFLLVP